MDEFVPVLQRAIQRLLAESNTARANGNTDWFVNQIQFLNSEDSLILSNHIGGRYRKLVC